MNRTSTLLMALAVVSGGIFTPPILASNSLNVNTINSRVQRDAFRPGEVIVKLKNQGIRKAAKLKTSRGAVDAQGASSQLSGILSKYGAKSAEELMPLTGATVQPVQKRAKALNGQTVDDPDNSTLYLVKLGEGKADIMEVSRELSQLDEVEYAEPNYIVNICVDPSSYITDPLYSQQYGPAAVGVDKLWNVQPVTDKRPVIAIIDTGVDITHPDLADNIWTNELEADGSEGRDDDANGFVDDVHGWDFVNNSPRMRDNNGHGTHCAGIAAAIGGNGIGITGANPDALIMPIAVMQSNGTGDVATIIKGIDYAAANGADVISMSIGGYNNSLAEHDALAKAYQKAVIVAAAGNDFLCIYQHDCKVNNLSAAQNMPMFPAAYNFVLGVEASADASGSLASFSNFDDDGPITSKYSELFNYELRAPGQGIMSTYPGGQYKILSGTSMACPLAAGAISRLLMCREISSKEELFGDLIATSKGNMDIFSAYSLTDADRKPSLSLVTYRIDDTLDGDGDGRPDAGETIRIYPTFRNNWGNAKNIRYSIRLAELEDSEILEFVDNEDARVISNMSSYAPAEAENPFIIKISPDCTDGRIICFEMEATCDNISENLVEKFELTVENGVELSGVLKEDMTLTPDKHYIITTTFVIPEGKTLTIEGGTTINFKDGTALSCAGNVITKGAPGNMITFKPADLSSGNIKPIVFNNNDLISYCLFTGFYIGSNNNHYSIEGTFENCIFDYIYSSYPLNNSSFNKCNIFNVTGKSGLIAGFRNFIRNSNICRNYSNGRYTDLDYYYNLADDNYVNSNVINNKWNGVISNAICINNEGKVYSSNGNYLGSANDKILRETVWDIHSPYITTFGEFDLSQKTVRPVHDAHGIVWKVVVNGYDAQDEYDMLPPLGVGKQKFEVYFNRKMNHDKAPMLAMGVREPYTQTAIAEDGSWRTETIDRNLRSDDIELNFSNPYAVYLEKYMDYFIITPRSPMDAVLTVTINGETKNINLKMDENGTPFLDRAKDYLQIGSKVNLNIVNTNAYTDPSTYENLIWISSDQSIATVSNNGVVTGVGIGKATITAKNDVVSYTSEITVGEAEFPDEWLFCNEDLHLLCGNTGGPGVPLYYRGKISSEIDIYTAYLTIKGKDNFDGVNTIWVSDAEDDEFFPIPIEDVRFHVNVQSAGAMSSGFTAEAGVGKVTLTWENPEENFDDMLGYNMYRYTLDANDMIGDTIRINEQLLDKEELIDYDITPGTTYCYYYKVLRTSLDENSPSKVVAATPRAAGPGDANASGDVDVADVVTEVNYMIGLDPKPFMFEAADINSDTEIDILDVVGTVNIIMKPAESSAMAVTSPATYSVENGILYIDSPVDLAGVQVDLTADRSNAITMLSGLDGMEKAGDWINDSKYCMLAFSLSGNTVASGRRAIAMIGGANVDDVILVDVAGKRIVALSDGSHSDISEVVIAENNIECETPFGDRLNAMVSLSDGNHNVKIEITSIAGATFLTSHDSMEGGKHNISLNTSDLSAGLYIVTLNVDGKHVKSIKAIKK